MIHTKNLKVMIAIWSGISQLGKYLHYMHIADLCRFDHSDNQPVNA